jgi:uncharacterized protein
MGAAPKNFAAASDALTGPAQLSLGDLPGSGDMNIHRTIRQISFHPGLLLLFLGLALTSCNLISGAQNLPPTEQAGLNEPEGLPNPASKYCTDQGLISEIRTAPDGSQYGVCISPDGRECDEWEYYRHECSLPFKAISSPTPTLRLPKLEAQIPLAPCAVLVNTQNGIGLTLFDPLGVKLAEWPTGQSPPSWAHIAGDCEEREPLRCSISGGVMEILRYLPAWLGSS